MVASETTIDQYNIVEKIGEGKWSTVYKAVHRLNKRVYAVKVFAPEYLDAVSLVRYEQEIQSVSGLTHRNLVGVEDSGFNSDGQPFVAMEYLTGAKSLAALLEQTGSLEPERVVDIFNQVATVLADAHNKGLLHRALKPTNILVGTDEQNQPLIRLLDLGIAQPPATDHANVYYMSPEQCEGKRLDARSDVYSVGCLMYVCLAGAPPYTGETFSSVMQRHVHDRFPSLPPNVVTTNLGKSLNAIILKCTEKDPEHRYQNMEELLADLARCNSETVVLPKGRARFHSSTRRFWTGVGITLVLGLGSIYVFNTISTMVRQSLDSSSTAVKPVPDNMADYDERAHSYRDRGNDYFKLAENGVPEQRTEMIKAGADSYLQSAMAAEKVYGPTKQAYQFLEPMAEKLQGRPDSIAAGMDFFDERARIAEHVDLKVYGKALCDDGYSHFLRADYAKGLKLYESSILTLKKAHADDISIAAPFYRAGQLYEEAKHFPEAARFYKESIRLDPTLTKLIPARYR